MATSTQSAERMVPYSHEAEQALLGALLVDREMLDVAAGIVTATDFYAPAHEAIFRTIESLAADSKPFDKLSVAECLRDQKRLENTGGLAYLSLLMDTIPTAASAEYFANIVREKALLRALIAAGGDIARLGFDGEADVDAAIAGAESVFARAVDRGRNVGGGEALMSALKRNYAGLLDRVYNGIPSNSQLTPWQSVNDLVGPILPGEMIVWAAGPKAGKSAALLMLADFVAAHYGSVAFFALEMGIDAVTQRLVALYSGVSARKQRIGDLTEFHLQLISTRQTDLISRDIELFDLRTCARLADIRRELRNLGRRTPIAAVVVDHVNFLGDVDPRANADNSSKHERLDVVYRGLLRIAKESNVVVHAVQHVNRKGMEGRPTLAHIRDGGNAEGHAHAIVFPYRPNPTGSSEQKRVGEFIVAAAREGEAGIAHMQFDGYRGLWLCEGEERPWFERAPAQEQELAEFGGVA